MRAIPRAAAASMALANQMAVPIATLAAFFVGCSKRRSHARRPDPQARSDGAGRLGGIAGVCPPGESLVVSLLGRA